MSGNYSFFFQNTVSVIGLKNWLKWLTQTGADEQPCFDNTATFHSEGCNTKIKEVLKSFIDNLKHIYESLEWWSVKQLADFKIQ